MDNLADKNPVAEKKAEAQLKKDLANAKDRSEGVTFKTERSKAQEAQKSKPAAYDKVFDAKIKQKQEEAAFDKELAAANLLIKNNKQLPTEVDLTLEGKKADQQKEKLAKSRAEFQAFKKKNQKGQEEKPIVQDLPTPKNKPAEFGPIDPVFDARIKQKQEEAAFQKKYDEDRANQVQEVKKHAQNLLIQKNKPLPAIPEKEQKQAMDKIMYGFLELSTQLTVGKNTAANKTFKQQITDSVENYTQAQSLDKKKEIVGDLIENKAMVFAEITKEKNLKNKVENIVRASEHLLDQPNDLKAQQAFEKVASDLKAPIPKDLKNTALGLKEKIKNSANVVSNAQRKITRGKGYERI